MGATRPRGPVGAAVVGIAVVGGATGAATFVGTGSATSTTVGVGVLIVATGRRSVTVKSAAEPERGSATGRPDGFTATAAAAMLTTPSSATDDCPILP